MNEIQKCLTFKDINFNGIESELLDNLMDNDNTNLSDNEVILNIDQKFIKDFNNRIVTPSNINQIIKICDYLLIKDTKEFLIKHSTPTEEKYVIDNYELSDEKKYILPIFMTKGIEKNHYTSVSDEDILYDNEDEYYVSDYYEYFNVVENALHEMVSLNSINWIEYFLKYFKSNEFKSMKFAVMNNNKECMKFLIENKLDLLNETATEAAAFSDNLEMLIFLRNNGCVWNNRTCSAAAYSGSLKCLEYAHTNNCQWNEHTIAEAARNNNIECLKYAIKNNCPLLNNNLNNEFEGPCILAAANNT